MLEGWSPSCEGDACDATIPIAKLLDERIVVLDGAWGVLIHSARLDARRSTAASASPTTRATSRAIPTSST